MLQSRLLVCIFNTSLKKCPTLNKFNNSPKNCIFNRNQPIFLQNSINLSTKTNSEATFEEIKSLKNDKKVLLIDVREPAELQETGEIPGSINIPLGNIENVLKNMPAEEFKKCYGREKPNTNFPLIFSCRKGSRSSEAQNLARKLGYSNVRNYLGGWLDWEEKIKCAN